MTAPHPSGSDRSIVVRVFGRTDVGCVREHNEDAFVVADLTRGNATLQPEVQTHVLGDCGTLFMVADGMGGAAAGEIASAMAVGVVLEKLTEASADGEAPDEETFAWALKRAVASANTQIHNFALEHPDCRGMGTTATVAEVRGDRLFLAQVGDSRAYLVRDGVAMQITRDQSLMQKLIEAGEMTEEEAEYSERRNIILQALGPESQVRVDLTHQQVRRGDVLILCSDGLSGLVKRDEIGRIVTEDQDPMTVCKRLIDRANEYGGPDNITVIAASFDGDGLISPAFGDVVGHCVFPLPTASGETPAVSRETAAPGFTASRETPAATRRATLTIPSVDAPCTPVELPWVSPRRRVRGALIALGLVIVFLALATWYVYRAASAVIAPQHRVTAAPTNAGP